MMLAVKGDLWVWGLNWSSEDADAIRDWLPLVRVFEAAETNAL